MPQLSRTSSKPLYQNMTFNNMRLSASTIADLYGKSLVIVDDIKPAPPRKEPALVTPPAIEKKELPIQETHPQPVPISKPAIHYTGSFEKRISVVIDNPNSDTLPTADFEMLQKLMTACKLAPNDFAIINVAINQPAAIQLWQLMPASVVLLFGVEYNHVGIPFIRPHFQVQHWDSAHFMSAPPLSDFQGADTPELKALKRELWNGLQKIFLGK